VYKKQVSKAVKKGPYCLISILLQLLQRTVFLLEDKIYTVFYSIDSHTNSAVFY